MHWKTFSRYTVFLLLCSKWNWHLFVVSKTETWTWMLVIGAACFGGVILLGLALFCTKRSTGENLIHVFSKAWMYFSSLFVGALKESEQQTRLRELMPLIRHIHEHKSQLNQQSELTPCFSLSLFLHFFRKMFQQEVTKLLFYFFSKSWVSSEVLSITIVQLIHCK